MIRNSPAGEKCPRLIGGPGGEGKLGREFRLNARYAGEAPSRRMQNGRRAEHRRPLSLVAACGSGARLQQLVLAAARGVDLLLQAVKPDGADDHAVADHVARRAVQAERLRRA